MSNLPHRANFSAAPISGDLHKAPNKPRTPNFPEDLCQSPQRMQSSGPPPEGPRDVHVLTADLVNNIPYKHWATGWRQGSDPVTLPNGCNTTLCSSTDVLNTLEKGSLGWWQEILAISAEELYYAKQDNGGQAVDDEWERTMGSTGTGTTYQNYRELPDRPAGPVRQSRPECPKPALERKSMSRAAMAEIATDIMATWASAERRVIIRDLIAEEPNQPEEMDEGLFVYHTDADKIALRKRFDASYANGFEEGRQMALQHEQLGVWRGEKRVARNYSWITGQLEIEREQELAHEMEGLRVREGGIAERRRQEPFLQEVLKEQERLRLLRSAEEQKDKELWNIRIAIRKQSVPWRHLVLLRAKINEINSVDCICPSPYCFKRSLKPQQELLKSIHKKVESQYGQQHERILRALDEYQARHNPECCFDKRMELEAMIDEIQEEEFQNLEHTLDDVDGMLKGVTPLLAIDFWHLCSKKGEDIVL